MFGIQGIFHPPFFSIFPVPVTAGTGGCFFAGTLHRLNKRITPALSPAPFSPLIFVHVKSVHEKAAPYCYLPAHT